MQILRERNVGFFANFIDVIRRISDVESKNDKWFVYWSNDCPYYDSNHGSNAWEYFFENINLYEPGIHRNDVPDLILQPGKNFRETINFYIQKYIILKPNIQELFDNFSKKVQKHNTLGVHIRKTDKNSPHLHGDPLSSLPLDNNTYKKYIDFLIKRDSYDKIFLITDDSDTLTYFKNIYNKKLIYTDAFRSTGICSIHESYKNISGYKKGLDVLIESLTLSKCNFLLRSTSNVSSTAQFFNLNLKH